ncbi:MAG: cysteine desulfurase [Nitrospirota bacterium]
MTFNVEKIREAFPILKETVYGKPLTYLDSAATSQKPQQVIDAISNFFLKENANVHRGVHYLSERATEGYEGAREKVRQFLNAEHVHEIIFVRGTTEAINLAAQTYGKMTVRAGDGILITQMEHHSNIVPWQMLCESSGAKLRIIPIHENGALNMEAFEKLISAKTKIVAVPHISNVLGTLNPIKQIVKIAHAYGARVLVDGAQAAPHIPIDVRELDCDFYALSGHKMYGPTGIGVLYGKSELLHQMPPYQGGGDMILSVSFEKTIYNTPPNKFEAGTPNMAGAIGMGAAIDFISSLDPDARAKEEQALLSYATDALLKVPNLRLIGTAPEKLSVLSFVLQDIHPHDIGTILDREGIAIRTGHHCAQPLMKHLGLPATARASLACYNTKSDIDMLVTGLHKVQELFR